VFSFFLGVSPWSVDRRIAMAMWTAARHVRSTALIHAG